MLTLLHDLVLDSSTDTDPEKGCFNTMGCRKFRLAPSCDLYVGHIHPLGQLQEQAVRAMEFSHYNQCPHQRPLTNCSDGSSHSGIFLHLSIEMDLVQEKTASEQC